MSTFQSIDANTPLPPGIADALAGLSRQPKPSGRAFDSFANGLDDLTIVAPDSPPDLKENKFALLCPRTECRSVILQAGVASLEESASVQMEPENLPNHSLLPAMPPAGENTAWWLIQPSPMQFDNIGFSRAVEALPLSAGGKKLKLLTCADCELGPLGWCEEGGQKFYLACSRVGYRS